MNESAPISPEIYDIDGPVQASFKDQLQAVVDHLGRVAGIEDQQLQWEAVNHTLDLLDVDKLQEKVVGIESGAMEIVSHFELLDVLPILSKIDQDAAEQKIHEFSLAKQYLRDREFTDRLIENVAEIIAGSPLTDVPEFKAEAIRGKARMQVYEVRSEIYELSWLDESEEQD